MWLTHCAVIIPLKRWSQRRSFDRRGFWVVFKEQYILRPEEEEEMKDKVTKSDDEWRQTLTPEQFRVARQKETERPFTGKYHDSKEPGIFRCAACGNELFSSDAKFDSGSGWPSFTAPTIAENVRTEVDASHGMVRTEVLCASCDSHLGHVFDDGPGPENLRYCINSVVLDLENQS
jgi:peptide-methionine (R)-S-oxide reductase